MPYIFSDTSRDKIYKVDGTPQQIIWAIGPLNSKDEAAKHYPAPAGRISGKIYTIITSRHATSLQYLNHFWCKKSGLHSVIGCTILTSLDFCILAFCQIPKHFCEMSQHLNSSVSGPMFNTLNIKQSRPIGFQISVGHSEQQVSIRKKLQLGLKILLSRCDDANH